MAATRKSPIGTQDFAILRESNMLYVDKTQFISVLLDAGRQYFLARPRRFGKSLFVSTLKCYFQGRKDLFEGLRIYDLETEWTEYPVFHIDFNKGGGYTSVEALKQTLDYNLQQYETIYGQQPGENRNFSTRFSWLLANSSKQTGKRAVVLIDEYDKPLLETMDNPELHAQYKSIMKGFYGVLKGMDEFLRFVFITGVTQFSKVSIFSDMNQLKHLSMDPGYSEICGITEHELLTDLRTEIQALADQNQRTFDQTVAELKKCFDGYHFSEYSADIYNPFSLLNTLDKKKIQFYWHQTGTPTFLVKMLQNSDFNLPDLERNVAADLYDIQDYRPENPDPIPVMFQTGYLTIKEYFPDGNYYMLGLPNEEVKYGFLSHLLPIYAEQGYAKTGFSALKLNLELKKGGIEGAMKMMQAFFAAMPYDLQEKKHHNERYYQSIFYAVFTLLGQYVRSEVRFAEGRADAVVKTDRSILVFEFKIDANASAADALRQIDDKNYLIPFQADGRELVKIGVAFNLDNGCITDWKIQVQGAG
jgi:hypothetical protein